MAIRIELLARRHHVRSFDCGVPELNEYLKRYALTNTKKGFSRTYVAVQVGDAKVLGYFSLCASSVAKDIVPHQGAAPAEVPCLLLTRLAVDVSMQGRGLGESLLIACLDRATRAAEIAGVHLVAVDALNERAARFYSKHGFQPLLDAPLHLFIPVATIIGALRSEGEPEEESHAPNSP